MARLLVVDDERSMREFLEILLIGEGHEVDTAVDVPTALKALEEKGGYDLVVTDLKIPGGSGLDVMRGVNELDPDAQIIMVTAFATPDTAVEAMKLGAYDYVTKPFKNEEIKIVVSKALEKTDLARENRTLREKLQAASTANTILGNSGRIKEVLSLLERVAPTGVTVLIFGESGTGKELVARMVHELSGHEGPFIPVNCSAIPEGLMESELFGHVKGSFTGAVADKPGLFEQAQGGTLFLDEVGELPLSLQPKLLRVLQEGKAKRVGSNTETAFDVRIVSATNRNLMDEVKGGNFREDLYYRLNVVGLEIPPLRERREDIPILAHHFLNKYASAFGREIKGIRKETLELLEQYEFPGNVRELENLVERAVALESGDLLGLSNMPEYVTGRISGSAAMLDRIPEEGIDLQALLDRVEAHYLSEALCLTEGNKTEAAKLLGLSFRSMRYRLDKVE